MNTQTKQAVAGQVDAPVGLLPLGPHDHPEPQTMAWSALELRAIRDYAARCVAAERERIAAAFDARRGRPCYDSPAECVAIVRSSEQPNVRHEPRHKGCEAAFGTSARWRG